MLSGILGLVTLTAYKDKEVKRAGLLEGRLTLIQD